jgi:RNA polymerase sigma factor (sigma-70 family)
MSQFIPNAVNRSRSVMAAVVFGTAFSAAASAPVQAATEASRRVENAIGDLSRYCQACWRNARLPADSWADCTQQVLARMLERIPAEQWPNVLTDLDSEERREFIRAIDAVKKRTQRQRHVGILASETADPRTRSENDTAERREAVRTAAGQVLSERQKQIVELSFSGWSIPEIAGVLNTTSERVSDEKYKAVQKLRTHFGIR